MVHRGGAVHSAQACTVPQLRRSLLERRRLILDSIFQITFTHRSSFFKFGLALDYSSCVIVGQPPNNRRIALSLFVLALTQLLTHYIRWRAAQVRKRTLIKLKKKQQHGVYSVWRPHRGFFERCGRSGREREKKGVVESGPSWLPACTSSIDISSPPPSYRIYI